MLRGGPCHMRLTVTCLADALVDVLGYPDKIIPCEVKREKRKELIRPFISVLLRVILKLILVRLMVFVRVSHGVPCPN